MAAGADSYLAGGGQIQVIVGQYDSFKQGEPFLSLKRLNAIHSAVNISQITGVEHDLKRFIAEGGIAQLGLHRGCFMALGLPYDQFDSIGGNFPYVKSYK